MGNSRFNYHPYLGPKYLTRGVGNYCMNCGRKMGTVRPDLKDRYLVSFIPRLVKKRVLIGFCHAICPSDLDDDSEPVIS